tara:strand:+ start:254 stop:553 length:300 start_codon:yes stop_codon:yes gene_type:complete
VKNKIIKLIKEATCSECGAIEGYKEHDAIVERVAGDILALKGGEAMSSMCTKFISIGEGESVSLVVEHAKAFNKCIGLLREAYNKVDQEILDKVIEENK